MGTPEHDLSQPGHYVSSEQRARCEDFPAFDANHLDRCLPSKRLNAWFLSLDVKMPSPEDVTEFVEDELNSCVDVKAAQAHVQLLIRRNFLKEWKSGVQQGSTQRPPGQQTLTNHLAPVASNPAAANPEPRPAGIDAKFKSACKRCGVWGHYSNWKA